MYAGSALLLAAFAVGCSAPSIGEEANSASDESTSHHNSSSDTGDDDDDDDDSTSEKSSSVSSADEAPTTTVKTTADAGTTGPITCTESGAIQFGGHCYFTLSTPATWDDAKTACTAVGAHLATLTSASEEAVGEALDKSEDRWIGLSRPTGSAANNASYVWVTNEPRGSFADWTSNEPNGNGSSGTSGPAQCTRLESGGGWADEVCAVKHTPLCERG